MILHHKNLFKFLHPNRIYLTFKMKSVFMVVAKNTCGSHLAENVFSLTRHDKKHSDLSAQFKTSMYLSLFLQKHPHTIWVS